MNRRSFLMFGAGQLNPYTGPGRSTATSRSYGDDISREKSVPPVPVGGGSLRDFSARCVGCLKCIPACPQGLLRTSDLLHGISRPTLDYRLGWCRPECNRCAEACPTGAILSLTPAMKMAKCRANIAVLHRDRCLAATGADDCHACERHCPANAISKLKVDADKCIGCGACEHFCPARPKAAIVVEGRT